MLMSNDYTIVKCDFISRCIKTYQKDIKTEIKVPIYYKDYNVFLYVSKDEHFISIGYTKLYFSDKKLEANSLLNYLSDDLVFALHFIQEWETIKEKIIEEIGTQNGLLTA
jgi:hypothetical protein